MPAGKPEYIVAGLGNPGKDYAATRHNAGFMALDHLAQRLNAKVNRAKFDALCGDAGIGGRAVLLMKPQTYMNASGIAISAAAEYYKIPPEHVIVLCDDITQALGKLRIRRSGSAGGHNGLKSIIGMLDSENFPRIRLGIGEKPSAEYDLAAWVTGKFSEADRKTLASRFDDVYHALELMIAGDFERAMCLYNGG
ncbi:MAG: aminoacyl-tRNA hydrolase [Clostridiales bacterium]|nr:MAG: aminoacyl-tRNA hydrolase [Clostridiales bacterium]